MFNYFIYGILFISIICPLINGFIALFNQIIENLCMRIAVSTAKMQAEIPSDEPTNTQCIGFEIPNYTEYECYEEDKKKRR